MRALHLADALDLRCVQDERVGGERAELTRRRDDEHRLREERVVRGRRHDPDAHTVVGVRAREVIHDVQHVLRAEVLRLRRDSTSHYDGVRDDLASGRKATESGTAILGEYAVHYFRVGDETRTMILRRDAETGAWHLSRELYANVEMLMTSAPVRKAVARVWAEEPR